MQFTKEKRELRDTILGFERRIEDMHLEFQKYRFGEETKMPDWERLERELFVFSRKKIVDIELSRQLDRILFKFQNRKKIWLTWADEVHHTS